MDGPRTSGPAVRFALGLGANLPHEGSAPPVTLAHAIAALRPFCGPLRIAPLYRTQAISAIRQADYFNTAVAGLTRSSAESLLREAWRLEVDTGRPPADERRRSPPDGPRTLDIDLLLYGDRVIARHDLTVPHPRLRERRFVLEPLAEILPAAPVPPDGRPVRELLAALDAAERSGGCEPQRVERIEWPRAARRLLAEPER